jgi:hypothetical protein
VCMCVCKCACASRVHVCDALDTFAFTCLAERRCCCSLLHQTHINALCADSALTYSACKLVCARHCTHALYNLLMYKHFLQGYAPAAPVLDAVSSTVPLTAPVTIFAPTDAAFGEVSGLELTDQAAVDKVCRCCCFVTCVCQAPACLSADTGCPTVGTTSHRILLSQYWEYGVTQQGE